MTLPADLYVGRRPKAEHADRDAALAEARTRMTAWHAGAAEWPLVAEDEYADGWVFAFERPGEPDSE